MTTGERIKARRKELDLSAEKVAEYLGVSPATIYRYENGDIDKIPGDRLEPIAQALKTTPAYIMGWEAESSPLPANLMPMPEMYKVPLLGRIACGEPILAEQNIEEYIDIPRHIKADYALLCKGDSMIDVGIHDGDVVYIRKQESVDNGDIAAVVIDDEATLKRIYIYEGRVVLQAENTAYPPLVYVGDEINHMRICGKAVAYTALVRR